MIDRYEMHDGAYQMSVDENGSYVAYSDYETLRVAAQAYKSACGHDEHCITAEFDPPSCRRCVCGYDALSKALEQGG